MARDQTIASAHLTPKNFGSLQRHLVAPHNQAYLAAYREVMDSPTRISPGREAALLSMAVC